MVDHRLIELAQTFQEENYEFLYHDMVYACDIVQAPSYV